MEKIRRGQPIDITGHVYGLLTAMHVVKGSSQGRIWKFKCACGIEKEIRLKDVRYGNTGSCGCQKQSKREKFGNRNPRIDMDRPWRKTQEK